MGIIDKLKSLNQKGNENWKRHQEKAHAENELKLARRRDQQRREQENKTQRQGLYDASYETGYRKGLQQKAYRKGYGKATGSGGSTAEHIITSLFGVGQPPRRTPQNRHRPQRHTRQARPQRHRRTQSRPQNPFAFEDPFPW